MIYKDLKFVVTDIVDYYNKYGSVSDDMMEKLCIELELLNNMEAIELFSSHSSPDEMYIESTKSVNSVSHLAHITGLTFEEAAEAQAVLTNTQHNDF